MKVTICQKEELFDAYSVQPEAVGYVVKQYSNKPVSSAHALVQYQPKRLRDPFDEALANYKDTFNNEFFFHAIRTGELVLFGKDVTYIPELKDSADYWSVNTYVRCLLDARSTARLVYRTVFL